MSERPGFVDVRKNLIHFPSLPVPLRVLTGLGIAQVLAGVLLLLFKDLPVAAVPVGMYDNQIVRIGWPFLLFGSLLLVSGWTYLLSGALQACWQLAMAALTLATITLWQTVTTPGAAPVAPLAALALWGYFLARKTLLRRAGLRADLPVLSVLLAAINLALFGRALAAHDSGLLLQYSIGVSAQVLFLLVLLIPMLVIAGLDLTEISAEVGSWLTEHLLDAIPLRTGLVAMLLLAVAKVGLEIYYGEHLGAALAIGVPAAALLAGSVALLIFALRREKAEVEPPGFGMLLGLSYLLFLVFIVAIGLVGKGGFGTAAAATINQLAVQATWALAGVATTLAALVALLIRRLRKRALSGPLLFLLIYGVWLLLSVGNPLALLPGRAPDAKQLGPVISMPSLDLAVTFAAVGGTLLLVRLHRLNRETLGFVFGILAGISLLQGVNALYDRQLAPTDLISLAQVALLLALLATGCYRTLRRGKTTLARRLAALGLAVLAPLFAADVVLIIASVAHFLPVKFTLPGAAVTVVILAIGLCWDMLMSGDRFTNKHSDTFPRHGRLLLYIGYVSLAAACLLWTKTLQSGGDTFFDEGTLPPYGIVVLGIPMLLYLWALAGHRLWNNTEPKRAE
jgi:uncharacterized membrane protein YhaH (DUF805 family)